MRSAPTFYMVTITAELIAAIASGACPSTVNVVERLVVPLPSESPHLLRDPDADAGPAGGMCPVENRRVLLQCFVGLRFLLCRTR
ncbi:hypothetical protein C8T65DRAFT_632561 [Cerioporus squamosus]|nr:hypothetical protein C8T65DRAFT_632561 [Cerioporus squamosus]